jgi:hypothetical protein
MLIIRFGAGAVGAGAEPQRVKVPASALVIDEDSTSEQTEASAVLPYIGFNKVES